MLSGWWYVCYLAACGITGWYIGKRSSQFHFSWFLGLTLLVGSFLMALLLYLCFFGAEKYLNF